MIYIIIGFTIIIIVLSVRLIVINRVLTYTFSQMEEIEVNPEQNRQLKTLVPVHQLEKLLIKINDLYQKRQKERILYQRRETQIRSEIENISHDLRTPLTSIIGYVDLIDDPKSTQEERQEYLKIIRKRAKVLQGFIQDFYELSRIEGDNYPLLLDAIQVQNALSEVIVAYYLEFEKRKIEVNVGLEEKPCTIIADKIQFNRVLNNLVQNALKYAITNFSLKQYTKNGECYIEFCNDTKQMKEEDLKLIFERFFTGDPTRNNQSTGLGLTITKLLVDKMKGKIDARLENDTFVIEIRWKVQ